MITNVLALLALSLLFVAALFTVSMVMSVIDREWREACVLTVVMLCFWSAATLAIRLCELVHLAQAARVTP